MTDGNAARISETGEGKFQVRVETGGTSFLADEPVSAGGLGSGPNPYELLSSALGACTAMTLRLYAARKGWSVEKISVSVSHERPAPGEKDVFRRRIAVLGDIDAAQHQRLIEIADRCPVHRTLERGSVVLTEIVAHAVPTPGPANFEHVRDMIEASYETG